MTRRRRRFILASGAVAATTAAAVLVFLALGSSVSYFYTPSDLAAKGAPERAIRLGGLVETGSLGHDALDPAIVTFVVTDGAARTPVRYRGILPDLFREGQGIVAQGRIGNDGALAADTVLAKHDENYMPKEVADALKAQGRWRDGGPAPPSQE